MLGIYFVFEKQGPQMKTEAIELMELFMKKNEVYNNLKKELEKLEKERELLVKQIGESIAPMNKITYKGRKLSVVNRHSKNGVESWYFRGLEDESNNDSLVID